MQKPQNGNAADTRCSLKTHANLTLNCAQPPTPPPPPPARFQILPFGEVHSNRKWRTDNSAGSDALDASYLKQALPGHYLTRLVHLLHIMLAAWLWQIGFEGQMILMTHPKENTVLCGSVLKQMQIDTYIQMATKRASKKHAYQWFSLSMNLTTLSYCAGACRRVAILLYQRGSSGDPKYYQTLWAEMAWSTFGTINRESCSHFLSSWALNFLGSPF